MNALNGKIIITLIVSFFIEDMKAQTEKKDIVINVGVYSGYGYKEREPFLETSGIPTMSISAECFINKYIAIGSYMSYTYVYDEVIGTTQKTKDVWRGWDLGLKPTFHFNPLLPEGLIKRTDIYIAGFGGYAYRALRYDKKNIYRDSLNYNVSDLNTGAILGFRYLFNNKLALYGELGKSSRWFIGGGITVTINSK